MNDIRVIETFFAAGEERDEALAAIGASQAIELRLVMHIDGTAVTAARIAIPLELVRQILEACVVSDEETGGAVAPRARALGDGCIAVDVHTRQPFPALADLLAAVATEVRGGQAFEAMHRTVAAELLIASANPHGAQLVAWLTRLEALLQDILAAPHRADDAAGSGGPI